MWFRDIFNAKRNPEKFEIAADRESSFSLSGLALRQLNRLILNTGPVYLKSQTGSRTSHLRKPAAEFYEQRQYIQGDDIRYVDWKASARQEHIYIKQGQFQKSVTIYILIDCSASMLWGDPSKSSTALLLANALSYLALAQNDRLVIIPVVDNSEKDPLRPLGPLWGKGQATLLAKYLQSVRFHGQIDLAGSLMDITRRKISNGGLVIVISDLLAATTLFNGLQALKSPIWSVILLHLLHPEEIEPNLSGHFELKDIESGEKKIYNITPQALETYRLRLNSWQARIAQVCRGNRALYTVIHAGWSLEKEIIPHLRRTQVVKSQ